MNLTVEIKKLQVKHEAEQEVVRNQEYQEAMKEIGIEVII